MNYDKTPDNNELPQDPESYTQAQQMLAMLIVVFALGSIVYRVIAGHHLETTSLMFIGLPSILAIFLALAPKPKSAVGSTLRGTMLFLLLTAPLLGEGFLCILIASPIFLGIALVIGLITDHWRDKRKTTLSCIALLVLPLSLEGIVPQLTHDRTQTTSVTRIINAPISAVEAVLAQPPRTDTPLPIPLRIGFPHPIATSGGGLTMGDTRTVRFSAAEHTPEGDLVNRVDEFHHTDHDGYLRLSVVSDHSKVNEWLHWRTSEISYTALDPTHTAVTVTLTFDRSLDPYWYFAPFEQLAAHETAKHLLAANATPAGAK